MTSNSPPVRRFTGKCPTCHFVVSKLGKMHYCAQFYYKGSEQFGTGIREFDDLFEYVTTLLRVQADHELSKSNT